MIAVCGCILATILGFLVGIIRLSSNWLFRNIAYVYVEFTRNVPVLLQIILYYSILLNLPKIKQAFPIFDTFYLSNRGLFSPSPIFKEGFLTLYYFEDTLWAADFFGNKKDIRPKPHKNKKVSVPNSSKRPTAVRKTGRVK